ncbi:MAG: hypothetical protein KIT82_22055 [Bradyrhizobium sp.]|nr:hypothetical protein [Bradyrhizobium sp.]
MSLLERVSAIMAEHGETMTLTRPTEVATITLRGKRIGGSQHTVGNADQQTFRVRIGTTELKASGWVLKTPSAGGGGPGDTLFIGGRVYNVLDVKPRGDGDIVALYDLEVAG